MALQLRWRHLKYRHMGFSDLSNIGANSVTVSLVALLIDYILQKLGFYI
jgi:hypothetical protein